MICGEKDKKKKYKWYYGKKEKELKIVSQYKYLGIILQDNGKWSLNIKKIVNYGRSKTKKMKMWLFRHKEVCLRTKLMLWNALVKPGMMYGMEIWHMNKAEENELNSIHQQLGSELLGICSKTNSSFIKGELGIIPWRHEVAKRKLWWLGRLERMDSDRWPKKIWKENWT